MINGITAIAEYNAKKALNLTVKYEYSEARRYYEEALRLDPYNYKYSFELSKLYSIFAYRSASDENAKAWNEAALAMAERSTSQNPYLPENIRALIRLYYDLDMPLEALEYAEKLISYQPCYSYNYELLARSYLEAAKYYIGNNDYDKAEDLLKNMLKLNAMKINKEKHIFISTKRKHQKFWTIRGSEFLYRMNNDYDKVED